MKLRLVAPAPPRASGEGPLGSLVPPLSLPSVAALTPREWEIELTDEAIAPMDLETDADLIGLTATTTLAPRAYALADEFRRRVKPDRGESGRPLTRADWYAGHPPGRRQTACAAMIASRKAKQLVHRFGSSPTKGRRIASASGSSHRQLHDGGYPPFLPFQPVFVPNTG